MTNEDEPTALDRSLAQARRDAEAAGEHDIAMQLTAIICARAGVPADRVYTTADLAMALTRLGKPTTTRQARRWIAKSGVGFQRAPGGNGIAGPHGSAWLITRSAVAKRWPDIAALLATTGD
jgi:hypothetical protein